MTDPCPPLDQVRAFAEALSGEPALARHVASCPRCQRLVDLARREEAALRQALPADVPKDLLARTLAAVHAERGPSGRAPASTPSRRRPAARGREGSRPGALAAIAVLALAVVVLALVLGSRHEPAPGDSPSPEASPAPSAAPSAGPTTPRPGPPAPSPASTPSPTPSPDSPEASPEPTPEASLPAPSPLPGATPGASPGPEAPPLAASPAPGASPADVVASRGRTLARVRSGKVAVKGRTLAPGDALPENEPVEAQGSVAEVEGEGAVALALAPKTKLTVRAGSSGETVFGLAPGGRLLARTTGTAHWTVETPDARVTPLGTELVVAVESKLTRVSLLEGRARVEVEKAAAVEVRAGFEAEVARGRPPEAPRPFAAPRAVGFLPDSLRPKKLPPAQRLVRAHAFEDGLEGATKGELVTAGGARGSRGCVKAAPLGQDYAVVFEMDSSKGGSAPVSLDPGLWVEATVKVSRRTRVVLQVWDTDAKENLAFFATVEPGAWTTVAAPLRSFGDANGGARARPVKSGDRGTCFSVFAGEPADSLELLVDDVRFCLEEP